MSSAYFEVYTVRYAQIWRFLKASRISLRELSFPIKSINLPLLEKTLTSGYPDTHLKHKHLDNLHIHSLNSHISSISKFFGLVSVEILWFAKLPLLAGRGTFFSEQISLIFSDSNSALVRNISSPPSYKK